MENPKQVFYFADPMCSWCWGFSPVVAKLQEEFGDRLKWALVPGGLRAGNREAMDPDLKEEVLGHWQQVYQVTGQPFDFSFEMPEGFCYDTEPACRAMVVMQILQEERRFDFLRLLHHAFYSDNQDITDPHILGLLSEAMGVNLEQFNPLFASKEVREQTNNAFLFSQQMGVQGFPGLIGQDATGYARLTNGYATFEQVKSTIQKWLEGSP